MKRVLLLLTSLLSLVSMAQEQSACHSVYPKKYKDEAFFYLCIQKTESLFGSHVRYAMLNSDGGGKIEIVECGRAKENTTPYGSNYSFDFAHPRGFTEWFIDGEMGKMIFKDREETYLTQAFSDNNSNEWTNKTSEKKYLDQFMIAISEKRCR